MVMIDRVRCAALLISLFISAAHIFAQTQTAMNAQARADFARADADLNKTYQAVLAKLGDTQSKQKLKETQRAWVASRDAEAARATKEVEGGSMAPTLRYEAMTRLTRERIKELKAMLDNRSGSGPKPAAASVTPSPALTPESVQHEPQTVSAESPVNAQQLANFEKIRDVSPGQKFAVRISCSSEPADPNDIDPNLITAVELVSLPSKKIVLKLPQEDNGSAPDVIWSQDSKWFAFSLSEGHRVRYTHVYHRLDNDFIPLDPEEVRIDVKGDFRNEYVNPIRWVRPGVLLLEQHDSGREDDATHRFTAKFDEKTGKFRVISKKKVPSKE